MKYATEFRDPAAAKALLARIAHVADSLGASREAPIPIRPPPTSNSTVHKGRLASALWRFSSGIIGNPLLKLWTSIKPLVY